MTTAFEPDAARTLPRDHPATQPSDGQGGVSSGINIAPGSEDDGWLVPEPVVLDDGSRLQLYKDGEALHAAYAAIGAAQRRICLEIYIFHSDDTGWAFCHRLCDKARQGVAVYVLYDSFGSINTDPRLFATLRAAGVHLQEFHPMLPWRCTYSWRPINRDHRKLLVIDDEMAGLGGLNVGAEYAGSWVVSGSAACDPWRDNAIGIVGPSARLLLRSFAKTWHYVTHGGRIGRAEFSHNLTLAEPGLGLLASTPTLDSPLAPLMTHLIRQARREIALTMAYFAPSDALIDKLCRAARRGVHVRLMLPGQSDVRLLLIAARSFYETLMCAGVDIYERQGAILHAKTLVIDGETSVLGSANLDYRSVEYNCELSALVHSRPFGRQMQTLFENDVRYARKISLKEWRRRPLRDRLTQWAVSRTRYLL
jgi:cardiolipin synthase